jgi:hypothetical protein
MASIKNNNKIVVNQNGRITSKGDLNISPSIQNNNFQGNNRGRGEFVDTLSQVIRDLEKYNKRTGGLEDAIDELRSAREKSESSSPDPSTITRFLRSAKGMIEEVAGSAAGVSSIAVTIAGLIKMAAEIFK